MSREINFRAYGHLVGQEYRMFHNIYEFDLYHGTLMPKWEGELICDHTLIQFTGLFDKNDTPIYEGDILSEPVSPVGGPDGGYRYKSRVIEWKGAGKGYGLFAPEAASIVIGNIHSNPELLESTK